MVKKKFDEFVRLNRGFDLPDSNIIEGEYPVVASTSIKAYHNEYKVKPPVVVTGRSGSLGTVQYIDKECWPLNTSLYSKDFRDNYPLYVYYFLQTMHLEQFNAGAGVPTLNQNHLQGMRIMIHEREKQEAVANFLYLYEQAVQNNTKRIKLLEQMAENLYKEWFVRFRFPGHEDVEFDNGLPKGWEVKRLKDYGVVETGKTPSTEVEDNYGEDYLFIKTPDMHGNIWVIDTTEKLSEKGHSTQKKKKLPKGSIMVSCIGTGGVVAINSKEGHTNQQINSIILEDECNREWLYMVCVGLKSTIEMFGATGSTMTNLSKGKFENLKIIEPPYQLRMNYHRLAKEIFAEAEKLMYANDNLIKQRDLLLPRLMSGKLEVK